jgi:hypothetical protein
MAMCRGCGAAFQWGFCDGKWVPLEPINTHEGMDRAYVDEDGVLRADHRDRHESGATVNVTRLDRKVRADAAAERETNYEERLLQEMDSVGEAQDTLNAEHERRHEAGTVAGALGRLVGRA